MFVHHRTYEERSSSVNFFKQDVMSFIYHRRLKNEAAAELCHRGSPSSRKGTYIYIYVDIPHDLPLRASKPHICTIARAQEKTNYYGTKPLQTARRIHYRQEKPRSGVSASLSAPGQPGTSPIEAGVSRAPRRNGEERLWDSDKHGNGYRE